MICRAMDASSPRPAKRTSTLGNTLWAKYFVDLGLLNGQAGSIEAAHAFAYPLVVAQQPDSQPQLSDGYAGDFVP